MPYLYTLMHEASAHGTPPLLPPFAMFPAAPVADSDALMLGPFLLACPVTAQGVRSVTLDLPPGPSCWFDFYTEERFEGGTCVTLAAPLDRLPLLLPAGAILPLTDSPNDFSRLHDEPSRHLRIFPGPGSGTSRFVLIEDDGLTEAGPITRVTLTLTWTDDEVTLEASAIGNYELPYESITVAAPRADIRRLTLRTHPCAPELVKP
jgi:alpha-glucosidase